MQSLGSLDGRPYSFGNDVNSDLLVVGGSLRADSIIAHLWTRRTGLVPLPTLGGARGLPEDVNELGQIAGNFETAAAKIHATLLVPIAVER
jgi:hypothetical protein